MRGMRGIGGESVRAGLQRRSSICRIASPRFHGSRHSSASTYTPSTHGIDRSEDTGGCSRDWPARKRVADGVSSTRMLSSWLLFLWEWRSARASMISGSLIVATEPEAARRRCFLLSRRELVRLAREFLRCRSWWASCLEEMACSMLC